MFNRVISSLRMNQDYSCFTCSSDNGVKIFNVEPLAIKLYLGRDVVGSVASTEMLFRSNLLAVVGGGMSSKFDEKAVIIWDESKPASEKILLDITFAQPILAVRMLKEKLVVVLRQEIHIFSFPSKIERLHTIDTKDNPRGLCEVSAFGAMMVFPAVNRGHVQLVLNGNQGCSLFEQKSIQVLIYSVKEKGFYLEFYEKEYKNLENIHPGQTASPVIISAHKSDIACVAISQCGSFIATASVKGTLIRVFDAATRKLIVELRRGADTAMFYCISFSPDASFLCASSDKGTVHIFAVKDTTLNRRSTFKSMGFLGPYVESQWGLANFTVSSECPCVCAFTDNQTVVAACVDGTFHKYVFTMDGNCNRDSFDVFLEMGEDMD